jgi:hypothetical protein
MYHIDAIYAGYVSHSYTEESEEAAFGRAEDLRDRLQRFETVDYIRIMTADGELVDCLDCE